MSLSIQNNWLKLSGLLPFSTNTLKFRPLAISDEFLLRICQAHKFLLHSMANNPPEEIELPTVAEIEASPDVLRVRTNAIKVVRVRDRFAVKIGFSIPPLEAGYEDELGWRQTPQMLCMELARRCSLMKKGQQCLPLGCLVPLTLHQFRIPSQSFP
jgi:hypothetical protein